MLFIKQKKHPVSTFEFLHPFRITCFGGRNQAPLTGPLPRNPEPSTTQEMGLLALVHSQGFVLPSSGFFYFPILWILLFWGTPGCRNKCPLVHSGTQRKRKGFNLMCRQVPQQIGIYPYPMVWPLPRPWSETMVPLSVANPINRGFSVSGAPFFGLGLADPAPKE